MEVSQNQHTARMRGGCRHETEPFDPSPLVENSLENYERIVGRAVLAGALTAEEAYQLIGNYQAWYVIDPTAPSITD